MLTNGLKKTDGGGWGWTIEMSVPVGVKWFSGNACWAHVWAAVSRRPSGMWDSWRMCSLEQEQWLPRPGWRAWEEPCTLRPSGNRSQESKGSRCNMSPSNCCSRKELPDPVSLYWDHLAVSGGILGCYSWVVTHSWHLVDRGQGRS
jgi:hypothetical protein